MWLSLVLHACKIGKRSKIYKKIFDEKGFKAFVVVKLCHGLVLCMAACDVGDNDDYQKEHEHVFGSWIDEVSASCEAWVWGL